jgi:hypothetical protein
LSPAGRAEFGLQHRRWARHTARLITRTRRGSAGFVLQPTNHHHHQPAKLPLLPPDASRTCGAEPAVAGVVGAVQRGFVHRRHPADRLSEFWADLLAAAVRADGTAVRVGAGNRTGGRRPIRFGAGRDADGDSRRSHRPAPVRVAGGADGDVGVHVQPGGATLERAGDDRRAVHDAVDVFVVRACSGRGVLLAAVIRAAGRSRARAGRPVGRAMAAAGIASGHAGDADAIPGHLPAATAGADCVSDGHACAGGKQRGRRSGIGGEGTGLVVDVESLGAGSGVDFAQGARSACDSLHADRRARPGRATHSRRC